MSERRVRRLLSLFLFLFLLLPQLRAVSFAATKSGTDPYLNMPNFGSITETGLTWKNSKTGFRVVIDDDIDLLTSAEERKLLEEMIPLTEYGSVALWSTRGEDADVQTQAEEKRRSLFGEESSCMLVINKASQRLSIHPGGSLAVLISAAQADRIVSRADKELARGHFFSAASDAFSRLAGLAGSTKSAASLRVFSTLFLALMIGLTLAGVFVLFRSRQGRHFE